MANPSSVTYDQGDWPMMSGFVGGWLGTFARGVSSHEAIKQSLSDSKPDPNHETNYCLERAIRLNSIKARDSLANSVLLGEMVSFLSSGLIRFHR